MRIQKAKVYLLLSVTLFLCLIIYEWSWLTPAPSASPRPSCPSSSVAHIDCSIDDDHFQCLRQNEEVFFPFSVLRKTLGVTGRVKGDAFEWHTSYSRIRLPDKEYDPHGQFGHFATYNVENRDRVKCINGATGVPMSTQWRPVPYYYPIQIAQYGLQHYSRMVQGGARTEEVRGKESREWLADIDSMDSTSERLFSTDENNVQIVNITTSDRVESAGVYVYLSKDPELHVVEFVWNPLVNASFSLTVSIPATRQTVQLHFVPQEDSRCVWVDDNDELSFSYSLIYPEGGWHRVTRDVLADVSKALALIDASRDMIMRTGDVILLSLSFHGSVLVEQNILQKSDAHRSFFMATADWLVSNQDEWGGWPVPVERSFADGRLVLPAGWHSAMAQGHALSVLTRAHYLTNDTRYLNSAIHGLTPFDRNASAGGVRASLFGSPWYEEYPTTPSSYVLNGFMYSLLGLYDLRGWSEHANVLLEEGVSSLVRHVLLFDTGWGSVYDLRHLGLHSAPNIARWDYHAVHVYLLKWIAQITSRQELDNIADRWILYAKGKKAKHN